MGFPGNPSHLEHDRQGWSLIGFPKHTILLSQGAWTPILAPSWEQLRSSPGTAFPSSWRWERQKGLLFDIVLSENCNPKSLENSCKHQGLLNIVSKCYNHIVTTIGHSNPICFYDFNPCRSVVPPLKNLLRSLKTVKRMPTRSPWLLLFRVGSSSSKVTKSLLNPKGSWYQLSCLVKLFYTQLFSLNIESPPKNIPWLIHVFFPRSGSVLCLWCQWNPLPTWATPNMNQSPLTIPCSSISGLRKNLRSGAQSWSGSLRHHRINLLVVGTKPNSIGNQKTCWVIF